MAPKSGRSERPQGVKSGLCRSSNEISHRNLKRTREALQHRDRRVSYPPLYPGNIRSVHPGFEGERLLREAPFFPQPPNVFAHAFAYVHRQDGRDMQTINLQTMSLVSSLTAPANPCVRVIQCDS